uniref:Kinesin family member 6 n=1 Tax=Pundamilia nyererei TaxID=303518 RepID=A0A3B4H2V0_9CICH
MVKETIQIFARIKPTKKNVAVYSVDNENQTGSSLEFFVPKDLADGFVNNKRECYNFRFQKVFDQVAKQEEIFENIAKPVADSVLAGYNGTIFAYGQTGSGKTFTITGGAERYSDRGIIPRTLSYLYERFSQDSSMVYTTHISYLEIYNEMGYDLLDSRHEASRLEDLPKVMIMEDQDQNIHLRNLSLQQSVNEEEALNLLFLGDTNRMIAETPMNQASTRSHCIFTVHLCRREPGSATLRRSKLHLVDLAGSDRVSKTGLNGQLLTDAKYINLSLHYLEQVIIALSEKNRSHIPYRNSMLTSVLRDSLGGNCMTTMIATMAVERRNLEVSMVTMRTCSDTSLLDSLKKQYFIVVLGHYFCILVKMLKKEKKRAQDAAAQLANITNSQSQSTSSVSTVELSQEGMLIFILSLSGPKLSMGKQEAFEIFIRDHEDHLTIEDNKSLLKQRSAEARKLGEELNEARNRISVMESHTGSEEEFDPAEENLCKHIEEEKKGYKSIVGRLKALRTEIEHLQLLLERSKVKLQKDFHNWWSQEASSLQVAELTFLYLSIGCSPKSHWDTEQDHTAIYTSSSGIWVRLTLTSATVSSSIPLTGDQQTDADILAFIRARQNLVSRAGDTHRYTHAKNAP